MSISARTSTRMSTRAISTSSRHNIPSYTGPCDVTLPNRSPILRTPFARTYVCSYLLCARAYAIPFYIDDVTDRHIRKRTLSFRKRTFLTLSLVFVFELMLAVVIPFCQVTCLFKINSCKETFRYRMGHHIFLTFPVFNL